MTEGIKLGLWCNAALLFGSSVALPFANHLILGVNPWIKPIKFEISILVFLFTIGLLLRVLSDSFGDKIEKLVTRLGWGFAIAMIVENTLIAMQSARGVRSHMNTDTAFDGAVFGIMGGFIAFNTLLLGVLLILFCRRGIRRPAAELWGIRLGLAFMLAGSLEGAVIVANGGHTVGAPDGGAGLPFLNWSTQYGDLRVAHFFALHALQFLWAAGWLAARLKMPERVSVGAVFASAFVYAVLVWALFAQAMHGHSVLALGRL